MSVESIERARLPAGVLLVALACVALLAGAPVVADRFPDYLPGYLIQIPALLIAYGYALKFDLMAYRWPERCVLLLAFLVPLQNTFILKAFRKAALDSHIALEIFRPSNMLLIGLVAFLAYSGRRVVLPRILLLSFVAGLAGWLLSSVFADFPLLAVGNGLFEFLAFWAVLYLFLALAPDRRFVVHAAALFMIAFALALLAQTASIIQGPWPVRLQGFPVFASDMLTVKMDLPLMERAGGNGYGNTDNLISLWVLVVVFIAGAFYTTRNRMALVAALVAVVFAGLLTYSRAGVIVLVVGLAALWLIRAIIFRKPSLMVLGILAGLGVIHLDQRALTYYETGIAAFAPAPSSPAAAPAPAVSVPVPAPIAAEPKISVPEPAATPVTAPTKPDASGSARLDAWRTGAKIAAAHPVAGIGFGHYALVDAYLTAPHNMLLLRFAEGGILSGLSLLLLMLYAPLRLFKMLWNREADMFPIACLVAVSAFSLKAAVFGANFAIGGMIPWGFGVALLIAASMTKETSHG